MSPIGNPKYFAEHVSYSLIIFKIKTLYFAKHRTDACHVFLEATDGYLQKNNSYNRFTSALE